MAKLFGSQIDLQKIPVLNLVVHSSSTEPTSPVNGQLWFDTVAGVVKVREAGVWLLVANTTGGSNPIGPAGGDLAGSYPNPTIGVDKVTASHIAPLAVTDAEVAAANKDGSAGVASMRTLGLGATQALGGTTRLDQIAVPTALVNINGQRLTGVATPSAGTDGANKDYVDGLAQGLDSKASVRAATTANITLSAPQTVDGVALVANDRVLVKNQTSIPTNGVYVVAAGAWTRATDFDTWVDVPGAYVFVESGTSQADTGWVSTADPGGTLGTTNITFTQFSSAGSYLGGAGLTLTGLTFDVVGTTNRITVAADSVDIAATYVGQSSITTLGTVTTGVWTGTAIAVANGGTGATTAPAARTNLGAVGKYWVVLGALTAGVPTTITHNLNTIDVIANFKLDATLVDVELAWAGVSANQISVTPDVSYAANAIRAVVIG